MITTASNLSAKPSISLAIYSMWLREVVRFWRQKSRVVGAIATPLLFWLVLGLGFGQSMTLTEGGDPTAYLVFFYPGMIVLVVLFTAIYSTISVIEDRREGFLQAVLVAPVPRIAVILGKMLGGTTIAVAEGMLLIVLGFVLRQPISISHLPIAMSMLVLIAFALTGLGLTIAWTMESTAGFHAVMNLLLMPMWLLCGAVFPLATAHSAIRWVMWINPLTYGMTGLRQSLFTGATASEPLAAEPGLAKCFTISIAFGAVMIATTLLIASRKGETGK